MNYYVEMIKDFVMSEIKKADGRFLDDGEYVYACGIAFNKLTARERKASVVAKRQILLDITTFLLFSVEMKSLIKEYFDGNKVENAEDKNLYRMIMEYEPKGTVLDQVLQDTLQEGLNVCVTKNRYERQERYQKKVGLVSKTYKLNGEVVEQFAHACKERGVALGPTLTDLMLHFIEDSKSSTSEM